MDLGVTMSPEVLDDKLEEGEDRRREIATWNTRRLPTRLTPGWTNRLFVASSGVWQGYFELSGDVLWNPEDDSAPYALIFNPGHWTPIAPVRVGRFRGWKYLETPPGPAPQQATSTHAPLRRRRSLEESLEEFLKGGREKKMTLLPPPPPL